MQDIFTSIKAYLYDRAVSPLTGAFFSAWIVWNYRFIIIVFSSDVSGVESKFQLIDEYFERPFVFAGGFDFAVGGALGNGFVIPIALAFSYLFVYPVIAKPVYEHSLKRQKELRAIKQEQEGQRLLSVDESREIYRRLAQMNSKHQEEVDFYNNQISSLNSDIERLSGGKGESAASVVEVSEGESEELEILEKYDEIVFEYLNRSESGVFRLNELFGQEEWSKLSATTRQRLGKRFRAQVERGDFIGVTMVGKNSGNQQRYYKN